MDSISKSTIKLVEKLKTERDEIRVQLHLAKEDLQDDWAGVEKKWQTIENKLAAAKQQVERSSDDVGEAVDVLAVELKQAYERIKSKL